MAYPGVPTKEAVSPTGRSLRLRRKRRRPAWGVGLAIGLLLTLAPPAGHAAPEALLYRLWLVDAGQVPVDSTVVFVDPDSKADRALPPFLAHGLLLSAGYVLLPVDAFEMLASQMGPDLLAMAGPGAGLALQGTQDGRISSLGALAASPGRPARFTWHRALGAEDWELIPTRIGKARVFPTPSSLLFQVEPQRVAADGRVLTEVRLEAEHEGRTFRHQATLPVGSDPIPIAGLLIRRERQLNLGPLPLEREEQVRLAALAVTAEPAPAFTPAPTVWEGTPTLTTAASLAPFAEQVAGWFGPLPNAPKPLPIDTAVRVGVSTGKQRSNLNLDLSLRWSEAARVVFHLEDGRAGRRLRDDPWGWLGLHTTLARRLELVGGAVLGPQPPRWYAGLAETTRPFPNLTLSAAYLLDVSGDGVTQLLAGELPDLAVFDPVWSAGATWQARPWRVGLEFSRPPDAGDQVALHVARLADGQEHQVVALALEAGVTYRWTDHSLHWRVGFRLDAWE